MPKYLSKKCQINFYKLLNEKSYFLKYTKKKIKRLKYA